MTNEIYQLKVDGEVRGSGTFEECMDEICKMRMHGCWFQNVGESVELTLIKAEFTDIHITDREPDFVADDELNEIISRNIR